MQAPPEVDRDGRRDVGLTGFAVIENEKTFAISIVDLSYDGCKIETPIALLPGLKLKISVYRLGAALDAVVCWCRDGTAGLRFATTQPGKVQKDRKAERIEISAAMSLRRAGRISYQCRVFDLTPFGCKVEFVERPRPGDMVWVKFDGLAAVEATVRWVESFYGGLEFVRPIHAAVFDLLLHKLKD